MMMIYILRVIIADSIRNSIYIQIKYYWEINDVSSKVT